MRVLDLFSGIGGFALGLRWAGFPSPVAFCEIDLFCRRVLAKHWPDVPIFDDVRELSADAVGPVDLVCGGFPCQDISLAGRGIGIDGARSGLWSEVARLAGELRPRFILVENVPALLGRGLGRVLGDLAALGLDAEWHVLGADAFGSSQHRERIWILAYPHNPRRQGSIWAGKQNQAWSQWQASCSEPLRSDCGFWPPGPRAVADIPRMADGPAHRLDRLRALGNAVVPQIVEAIGRAIMDAES